MDVETIREAIRRAPSGITTIVVVYIKSRIYNEHIVIPGLPKFQFVGENWQTTIIQGELYRIENELSTLHTARFIKFNNILLLSLLVNLIILNSQ